jgi:hypothetical protein
LLNYLTIDGHNSFQTTHIGSMSATKGNSGRVYIKADNINLLNAGTILATSGGISNPGNAGDITVETKHIAKPL